MKPNLPRGFRTRAEQLSLSIRHRLQLRPTQACPARRVAELYGYSVTSTGALVQLLRAGFTDPFISSADALSDLQLLNAPGFSGMMAIFRAQKMLFYNDQESVERQESVLMHELSHALCEHDGDDLQLASGLGLRLHDNGYEDQARWLGGVLQIPDPGLYWYAQRGYSHEAIARTYGASLEMVQYRWNVCGIAVRLTRRR